MVRKTKVIAGSWEVIRPVCVCLFAIAIVAWAMAIKGLNPTSLELGLIIVGLGAIVVMHVHRATAALARRSAISRQAAKEAEGHYTRILVRIVEHAEARDSYWVNHSRNVGLLCEKMARKLGMPKDQCKLMKLAGRLHDIGILTVPASVRLRRSRLAAEEFRKLQRHPDISYEMLEPLKSIEWILPAVRYHHERMNGTGYPKGLAGEEIPLAARIVGVADSYDAMTHDRPHRPAMAPIQAIEELRHCTPSGYDRNCVDALAEIVNIRQLEMTVAGKRQRRLEAAGTKPPKA
ncbi:MAG: HD-GYP domain-containing protein [Planctomycetota bacterium]